MIFDVMFKIGGLWKNNQIKCILASGQKPLGKLLVPEADLYSMAFKQLFEIGPNNCVTGKFVNMKIYGSFHKIYLLF